MGAAADLTPEKIMDAIPLKPFLALLTEGLRAPRPVARRVIAARPDAGERLALVGLAAALQGLLWVLASLLGSGVAVGALGHVVLAAAAFLNYALTATAAFHIGRRFGGRGSPQDVATAVAWQAVLVAALTPMQALALGGADENGLSSAGALTLLVYVALNIWLLSACVAEAHQFTSTARVAGVATGLFFALGVLMSLLLGGLATP